MKHLKLFAFALCLLIALFVTFPAFAQDTTPPTPAPFDLSAILASLGVYLVYLGTQATAAQAAIAKIKPVILEPLRIRAGLDDAGYNVVIGFVQFVAGVITMLSLGGLDTAKAALAPVLAVLPIPDAAVLVGSLLLLVAGQDAIYGLIKGLYATQEGLAELEIVDAQEAKAEYQRLNR